jgi:hypothetical protein
MKRRHDESMNWEFCRQGLAQLVRFLVVELIHPDLNLKFDTCVVFMINYFFSGDDVPVDSEMFFVTVNLNIKPVQSFRGIYRGRMCVCVFIEVSTHTYMIIYIYTVFLKK